MLEQSRANICPDLTCKVILVRENFAKIEEIVAENGVKGVDFILADLGFCSGQIRKCRKRLKFSKKYAS